jgi:Ulp1 family protease
VQRLRIPDVGNEKAAYLDSDIMDVMISRAVLESEHVQLVGRSSFFYKKIHKIAAGTYKHCSAHRETKHQDLFLDKKKLLIIPICENLHWYLVGIDLQAGRLYVFDSLGRNHSRAVANIRNWLHAELEMSNIPDWENCKWEACCAAVNMQGNSYDCGVFVIGWIQAMATHGDVSGFTAGQATSLRHSILNFLVDGANRAA